MTQTRQIARDASELRAAMVEKLAADKFITSESVAEAMRTVPRHVFTPGTDLQTAYAVDEVVRYGHNQDGECITSVSAPWIVAAMLEAAGIEPGMRVLEIGSGGYNASLLTHLVGERGLVVSLDIDPQVTMRANSGLAQIGCAARVAVGDGEYGLASFAPYDRILVTVCAWVL